MQFYNHNAMRVSNKWKEHSIFTFNRLPKIYIKRVGNDKKNTVQDENLISTGKSLHVDIE